MMEIKRMKTRSNSMRRFLRDVLKPTPALSTLGKRERTEDLGDHKRPRTYRPDAPLQASSPTTASAPTACIALQNEDPLEDAIVITALSVAPFCCHADLITMSRTQLLTVAAILNAKLPRALQIDVGPGCSDVAIRYAIELLVGLRENPLYHPHSQPAPSTSRFTMVYGPGTPLRAHSLSPTSTSASTRHAVGPSPSPRRPASPLVRPSRHSISLGSPALPILHEDAREREEGSPPTSEAKRGPPQKKRRTDAPITRALSHRIAPFLASAHLDGGSERDTDSPTPSPRIRGSIPLARPHTIAHDYDRAETSPKKARGYSGARPVRAKSLKAYMHMTSTPKRYAYGRAEAAVNSPEVARRFMSLLADIQDQERDQDHGVGGSHGRPEREQEARSRPGTGTRAVNLKPRLEDTAFVEKTADYPHAGDTTIASVQTQRREDDTTVVSVSVKVEELEPELTFGLDEMTMPVAGIEGDVERSEIDIS